MTTDEYSREQRLRKQAELQSLYTNLANLRAREASYIEFGTIIPDLLISQINEVRHKIEAVENELLALGDKTIESPARQAYRDAFAAELAGDITKAISLYRNASRHNHPDGNAALRSVRYAVKTARGKLGGGPWAPVPAVRPRTRVWIALAILLIVVLIVAFSLRGRFTSDTLPAVAEESTATPTPPTVVLIIPDTATPMPTNTPTHTPTLVPTDKPPPTPTVEEVSAETPTPAATLQPPPKIIGPKDGLVWKDGTIVFEFEDFQLPYNQLYCLNSMRGFDKTNTENWSHPPVGNKRPSIPIEAHVFRIAKQQGIRCVVWSASIGQDSCDNIISKSTEERVIGLPQVCNFDDQ
jgi:hypothetical protein